MFIILPPWFILPPVILPPWNGLMIYTIYPCPISFCPLIILPPIVLPPGFILPPFILPPGNDLLIYTIYPCPISILHYILMSLSFCPLDSFCPLSFCPWKWFNDLHYLPMSHIILPPYHFAPYHFAPLEIVFWFRLFTPVQYHLPPGFILPPGNDLLIYTIYLCPISSCPLH